MHFSSIDWTILGAYFAFVLAIGVALRGSMRTSSDFFLSGRALPAWVSGLAFLSANLGAQEVHLIYALHRRQRQDRRPAHFTGVGAIPAMVFLGLFMMPFYYGSRARSVPEYLKLRFDEKTRGFNAIMFACMTVLSSGISMYAMGLLLKLLLGWSFDTSVWVSALIVLAYILLGGLTSAIYNEVLQFFLIVAGFLPLVYLGLRDLGGWSGLKAALGCRQVAGLWRRPLETSAWNIWLPTAANPHGRGGGSGLVHGGLGVVLSFGYWCTDFLVVQRAQATTSMSAARAASADRNPSQDAVSVSVHLCRGADHRSPSPNTPPRLPPAVYAVYIDAWMGKTAASTTIWPFR